MFSQPITAPPPGPVHQTTTTISAAPTSSSRSGRLRGFSYHLRNYTHNHLLSRDTSSGATNNSSSTRGSGAATTNASQRPNNLVRSASYQPQTPAATSSSPPSSNRLTLYNSNPDPSTAAAASRLVPRSATTSNLQQSSVVNNAEGLSAADRSPSNTPEANGGQASMTRARSATAGAADDATPTIRFSAYYDPRATRPSLTFSPITRSYPNGATAIRVGRYSERDIHSAAMTGNVNAATPVGFKSKVVSRKHCEFWCEEGKWFIKDVKSSSGTFLNHIRLSAPSQESKAFPIADGDIIQLGIDFKGGEEMIFRCVKMRVELNRGWQNKLNTFNIATHNRLRTLAKSTPSNASNNSQDCSICLNSIAPCQSLFVAPCSHTWHFKCVRKLLNTPQYPVFICPNCRAGHDLEADVEEPEPVEDWEEVEEKETGEEEKSDAEPAAASLSQPESIREPVSSDPEDLADPVITSDEEDMMDLMDVTVAMSAVSAVDRLPSTGGGIPRSVTAPLPIQHPASGFGRLHPDRDNRTPSPPSGAEGPITPRNDAGPWVFDGSAGRAGAGGVNGMSNLDAAVDINMNTTTTETKPDDASGP